MQKCSDLVIVLLGPTAGGKTSLAIKLAEAFNLKIHNVDSRQVYVGMNIGTAKPTKLQQNRVDHFLLDISEPNEPITVKEFQTKATASIKKVLETKGIGFLVGGSGLYLKAITQGLQPPAVVPQKSLRNQLSNLGQNVCYQLLTNNDPIAANKISPNDAVRTQRALEVLYATGHSISSQQKKHPPNWRVLEIGLDPPDLKERISNRTEQMFQNGLLQETEVLIERFSENLPLLQTIGYKEASKVIKGQWKINKAIQMTTIRTQQFAKRQRTWFRGQHKAIWLNNKKPLDEAMSIIQSVIG